VFSKSFWPAWPRKVSKAEALRAWLKHASSPEAAAMILKAAKDQIAMLTLDGLKFCPHAASWLNAKRFEDDPNEAAMLPAAAMSSGPAEWKPNWEENHG
jgi:DNA replication protein DnaC